AVGEHALGDLEPQRAIDDGPRPDEGRHEEGGDVALGAPDLDEVAKPGGGQQGHAGAAALEDRVRAHGRAVHEPAHRGPVDLARPLPPLVESLRTDTYPRLATLANAWEEALGSPTRYPRELRGLLALCRRHGQTKPTPLLLHYEAGGYNCLHQDLYGDVAFPL